MEINSLLQALPGAVSQGVLWGIMVLGVYITYKILDIADLTVDGSFAMGGCVCAVLVADKGWNPLFALLLATVAGLAAGAVTGFLHTAFEIPAILAGILTQIGLWSVNLKIMGRSNIGLLNSETIFTKVVEWTGWKHSFAALLIGLAAAALIIVFLYWFFGTELGSALRATGNNEDMIRALGTNTKVTKLFALMLSNGLVGLSGGLVGQSQRYGDIGMGTGAIVTGLAAIVIGDILMGRAKSFGSKLTSAVLGSVVYYVIRAFVLWLGLDPNNMKLLTAVMVAVALCIPVLYKRWKLKKAYSEEAPTC